MSDNAQPEKRALQELQTLVHHLADELAGFRRRALQAEGRLRELEAQDGGSANADLAGRVVELEEENRRLQKKLEQAKSRASQMLDRVKFLRQQAQAGGDR